MNISTKTLFIFILALSLSFSAQSMSNKVYSGYIVTNAEDTLHGQIRMLTPAMNEVKVKFIDNTNKQHTYKASDLLSYAFKVPVYNHNTKQHDEKWIFYVRKTVDVAPLAFASKDVLVERPVAGSMSVYNFYMERADVNEPIAHKFYVEKSENVLVSVDRENFKGTMKNLTADYPELCSKIGKKGYGYKHMSKIAEEYNTWKEQNTARFVMN